MTETTQTPQNYTKIDRNTWKTLNKTTNLHLGHNDINKIASIGDPIDMEEIDTIYKPLCALLQIHYEAHQNLKRKQTKFFNENSNQIKQPQTPYIIAIAGSVAVGKSSVARLLQKLLQQLPSKPKVELVTTDGFLHPNKYLQKHNLMDKKGFPISYDTNKLTTFITDLKTGKTNLQIPKYSHIEYDIKQNETQKIQNPNIVIIEGLNVLQIPTQTNQLISDHFNQTIYINANPQHIEKWYINRFLQLRKTAFTLENSYFKNYANLNDEQATQLAKKIWETINLKNLKENIEKTKNRAEIIINKDQNHKVENILLKNL